MFTFPRERVVDRTEQDDLVTALPERVQRLAANWHHWAKRTNVLPLGTWKAKPAPR